MKYQENPIKVDAYKIYSIGTDYNNNVIAAIDNGESVNVTEGPSPGSLPVEGDYWVVLSDGHSFWVPKKVFEDKYSIESPYTAIESVESVDSLGSSFDEKSLSNKE